MRPLLAPIARTYGYRLLTRLPPKHRSLPYAQRLLGGGPLVIPAGVASGCHLAPGLPITHVQGYGLVRGALEPSVQEALRRNVAPGMTVYDIGANLGFFTLVAARLAGPAGRVIAFEPVPESAEFARETARLNGLRQIRVDGRAVSDRTGRARFLQTAEASWSHLADRGPHRDTQITRDVWTVALDDAVGAGELPPPDVVKVDVEGSELAVIRGMSRILERRRPVVICEVHETNAEFVEAMAAHDYVVENLERPLPVAADGPTHGLALPAGRVRSSP